MNLTSYLEQLLKTGTSALGQATSGMQPGDGRKYATGAAVGGVLGLLLGSKSGRRMGSNCLLYTSPSPRDRTRSRMPSSA